MRKSILMLTAVAVSMLAVPALAQQAPGGGGAMMSGGGRGPQMSEGARIMQFINQKGMTPDAIQAERTKMRDMTAEDRAKLTADLEAQWAKVPAAQQASYKAEYDARPNQGRGGAGGGRQGGGQ